MVLSAMALLLLLGSAAGGAAGSVAFEPRRKNEVTSLPGFEADELPSRHFTGHIPVHGGQHQLWYWLVESEGQPAVDPVLLWLTGGPGCSSMDALIYENGPFKFSFTDGEPLGGLSDSEVGQRRERGIRLRANPYSWSKAATMVYVDSPVRVGLSYSTTEAEIHTDDQQTTADLLEFLTQLLLRDYPHLLDNPLYITGESYAGVFVPLLATKLLRYNQQAAPSDRLNLKGYAVGNGVTDDRFDGDGQPEFAYAMGLIDPPTYTTLQTVCQGSFWNATPGGQCAQQLHDAYDRFYWLNPYDILEDCFTPRSDDDDEDCEPATPSMQDTMLNPAHVWPTDAQPGLMGPVRDDFTDGVEDGPKGLYGPTGRRSLRMQQPAGTAGTSGRIRSHTMGPRQQETGIAGGTHTAQADSTPSSGRSGSQGGRGPVAAVLAASKGSPLVWPLAGVRAVASARTSWHTTLGYSVPCSDRRLALAWLNRDDVRRALHAPPVAHTQWQPCSEHVHYQFVPVSMIPNHLEALQQGLRVLVYSGDHDFVVPFTGTRDWVYSLGLTIQRDYAPWTIDGQVAGFLVEFTAGLQFATVKGAGHMVPQTSPARALHLITRFLYGTL